ncbi:MAG: alpha/beta hydrolase [Casimicrobiaceae bacterium]|nr:alpha/beta hydrolase [Casimicrobiaceae bacterium]
MQATLRVAGPVGVLEVAVSEPTSHPPRALALLCHPHPLHGGTMDNKVVQTLAKAALDVGAVALRFNFRGVGGSEGRFDHGLGETEDASAVIAWARERFGALPLLAGGFSFGAYVWTRLLAREQPQAIVLVGPAVGRFEVGTVPEHSVVIHGEADEVVPLADVLDWARPQGLPVVVFPGVGHFFHGQLAPLRRVVRAAFAARLAETDP